MSSALNILKNIANFPGALKDLLVDFEARLDAAEKLAKDQAQLIADLKAMIAPKK